MDIATPTSPRAGGLAVGLAGTLEPGSLWFGWSGKRVPEPGKEAQCIEADGITYATLDLSEADYRAFYLGFSNGTLWPLFHMMLGFVTFERSEYTVLISTEK